MMSTKRDYRKIIAVLCAVLVFFAAAKIKATEKYHHAKKPGISRCDTDSTDDALPQQFTHQSHNAAARLSPQVREVTEHSPTSSSHAYRGPPGLI